MAIAWTARKAAAAVDHRFGVSRKHDFCREITSGVGVVPGVWHNNLYNCFGEGQAFISR
jgi:hypothetical protein